MTNLEKQELRQYCKEGLNFKQIRELVNCADGTIRQYLKIFAPKEQQEEDGDE